MNYITSEIIKRSGNVVKNQASDATKEIELTVEPVHVKQSIENDEDFSKLLRNALFNVNNYPDVKQGKLCALFNFY